MASPNNSTIIPRIFVSHSHVDNEYCRAFVAALRQQVGSTEAVWYDEHNLGWGKLRREIDRELARSQHFIAILSPTAVNSDWVNDEIDAAIELRRRGSMQTIQFVMALPCEMSPLLSNYKRVVAPNGQPYIAAEAAARALGVIRSTAPTTPSAVPALAQQAPPYPVIASDNFPQRLVSLGFVGKFTTVHGRREEYIVPPACDIPAGPFLMGSDPQRDPVAKESWVKDEQPQHSITLPAYQIARYPVTVAEYACFVRAGHEEPNDWQKQLNRLDHPVVNISWKDAVAYALWLAFRNGYTWRLPSEAEWEKAARGTDGRIYPWGDSFDKSRCNSYESGIRTTTPIGSYPSGASPYGVHDLAGNVWEWTNSAFFGYPYNSADGREDANSIENRVLRGGAWSVDSGGARAAYRYFYGPPDSFDNDLGFRLVSASPSRDAGD